MDEEIFSRLKQKRAEVDETLERFMGDKAWYYQLLTEFPDNQNIIELRKAVDNHDAKLAEREVHTLKGVALNLGFLSLRDVCMDMLMDLRDGEIEDGMAQIDAVEACFADWVKAIKG